MINRKSLLLVFCVCLLSVQSFAQSVYRLDAIGITVSDMDRALTFYTKVLPFEKVSETEVSGDVYEHLKGEFGIRYKKVRLKLGEEQIELTDYLTTGGRKIPEDSRSNDIWFQHIAIVVSNMDSAYARLRRHNVVHVSTSPQTLPKTIPAASGVKAFYFHDPDGHNLELIYFPEGKGNPKWHSRTMELFLGIDHTAIGISNTKESASFYNNLLGLELTGESFNFGTEQEHLNNVFGASLHISGNKTTEGPGVEFLEYITPNTGRSFPKGSRTDDLNHWETIFLTRDPEGMFEKLKKNCVHFISSSVIRLPQNEYGYKRGFLVRDPDGHAVGIFEKEVE